MKNKKLSFLLICLFLISLSSYSQTIEVSGIINENTNWDADTVKIIGDVTVESNVQLSISPGVFIEAQGYYKLNVAGKIHALGLPNDTITFTVNDTTGFWADTLSTAGGWHGIYIIGEDGSADSSVFKYCKLQYGKNYGEYGGDINGGALYVYNHGNLHINHCLFTNNMVICYSGGEAGPYGGAVFCENVNTVLIDSNSFIKNRSFDFGGAIRIDANCENTVINRNIFINNVGKSAGPGTGGGGAAICTSDLVHSPEISNNYCFNNKGLNGIIYTSNPNGRIYNNVICNNWGSGIMDGHQMSTTKTFNNTIVNNRTRSGGIQLFSRAEVYNNICWGNEFVSGNNYNQIKVESLSNPVLKYNCVQYGDGGPGAISDYPEFINPTEGVGVEYDGASADWTVENWSLCINAGTPDTNFLTIPEYDIIGNPRIFGNRIDMGAYENQEVWASTDENVLLEENVSVSPNPGTDKMQVLVAVQHPQSTIELYDIGGNIVARQNIEGQWGEVNTSFLPPGTYVYKITSPDGLFESGKWVKQ